MGISLMASDPLCEAMFGVSEPLKLLRNNEVHDRSKIDSDIR